MELRDSKRLLCSTVSQLLSFCVLSASLACTDGEPGRDEVPASGPITIAVAGDTLLMRPVDPRDAGIAGVRDLMRGAALAFVNLNGNILEETPPAAAVPWPFARPRDAAALRDLGVDVGVPRHGVARGHPRTARPEPAPLCRRHHRRSEDISNAGGNGRRRGRQAGHPAGRRDDLAVRHDDQERGADGDPVPRRPARRTRDSRHDRRSAPRRRVRDCFGAQPRAGEGQR